MNLWIMRCFLGAVFEEYKKTIIIIGMTILLLIIFVSIYLFSIVKTGRIYNNIYINGVNVSNLSRTQASDNIKNRFVFGKLTLYYGDKKWSVELEKMGFSYDVEKAVNEACNIGRDKNLFQNIIKIVSLKHFDDKEDVKLYYFHNYKNLENFYNKVAKELNTEAIDASISIQNDKISINPGRDGKKIAVNKLINDVKTEIENNIEPNINIKIPFEISSPKVKYSDLKAINGVISSFQSRYPTSDAGRAFNVELSARKVDNQLLMPGQEVSFMRTIGDITKNAGFREAPIILNNEYVDGIGGGVCQVSSTLYNALLESNIEIKERSNHTFPVKYVPVGRDATVAESYPDLKYRNNYPFPIYIKNYAYNGVMTTKIYGDVSRAKKVQIFSEITSSVQPNTIYRNDPSLKKGVQVIEDSGQAGYRSMTYKIENGERIIISRDLYAAKPQIIRIGTKK